MVIISMNWKVLESFERVVYALRKDFKERWRDYVDRMLSFQRDPRWSRIGYLYLSK